MDRNNCVIDLCIGSNCVYRPTSGYRIKIDFIDYTDECGTISVCNLSKDVARCLVSALIDFDNSEEVTDDMCFDEDWLSFYFDNIPGYLDHLYTEKIPRRDMLGYHVSYIDREGKEYDVSVNLEGQ